MSETVQANRRFWRIHLSTAVLLMLITGLCLGVNLSERVRPFRLSDFGSIYVSWMGSLPETTVEQGFPLTIKLTWIDNHNNKHQPNPLNKYNLLLNLLATMLAAILTAIGSEYLIRRREGRKP